MFNSNENTIDIVIEWIEGDDILGSSVKTDNSTLNKNEKEAFEISIKDFKSQNLFINFNVKKSSQEDIEDIFSDEVKEEENCKQKILIFFKGNV